MSRWFQFSLKWLFVTMLAVACFFGGIRFERERQRRVDVAAALAANAAYGHTRYIESAITWETWEALRTRADGTKVPLDPDDDGF